MHSSRTQAQIQVTYLLGLILGCNPLPSYLAAASSEAITRSFKAARTVCPLHCFGGIGVGSTHTQSCPQELVFLNTVCLGTAGGNCQSWSSAKFATEVTDPTACSSTNTHLQGKVCPYPLLHHSQREHLTPGRVVSQPYTSAYPMSGNT